jgi:VanZ family protein
MAVPVSWRIAAAWLPAIAYTLLIWWLSSQVLDIAYLERVPFKDKGVHFLEYGALAFFLTYAVMATWVERGWASYAVVILMTAGLGLLDELHQGFVPGRNSDLRDLAADTVGAIAAVLIYAALRFVRSTLMRRARSDRTAR